MLVNYLEKRFLHSSGWVADNSEDDGGHNLDMKYIVIISVGSVVALLLFGFACYRFCYSKKSFNSKQFNPNFHRNGPMNRTISQPVPSTGRRSGNLPPPTSQVPNSTNVTDMSEYTAPTLDPPPSYMAKSEDITIGETSASTNLDSNPPQDEYNTQPSDTPSYVPPETPPPVHHRS